jgi:hypothetical protein
MGPGSSERRVFERLLVRCAIVFGVLLGGLSVLFWMLAQGIQRGTAQMQNPGASTYAVKGTVRDARTGRPVPWVEVADDAASHVSPQRATGDLHGSFLLQTRADPHPIRVTALGYRPRTVWVGSRWFFWASRGEQVEVKLEPE